MRLLPEEKAYTLLKKSKWSTIFLFVAFLQLIFALALLIPTLVNVRKIYYMGKEYASVEMNSNELFNKAFKVSGECIMFIIFEIWKLWLAIDGVLQSNSRTVWASASFTVFSVIFSFLMIFESINWKNNSGITENVDILDDLLLKNRDILISLSCIIFIITPATFFSVYKVARDFGWDVYKKIGSSIEIQKMFITVQWFSLTLKLDIYFEFCAYVLYCVYLLANKLYSEGSDSYSIIIVSIIMLLVIPSFILSRYAISMENRFMMILFIVFQFLFIGCTVFIMAKQPKILTDWYAFTGYCLGSLIAAVGTIVLSIMCLLNFNKGLKEFVIWKPFTRKRSRRQSEFDNNMVQTNLLYGLEAQKADRPIDDE